MGILNSSRSADGEEETGILGQRMNSGWSRDQASNYLQWQQDAAMRDLYSRLAQTGGSYTPTTRKWWGGSEGAASGQQQAAATATDAAQQAADEAEGWWTQYAKALASQGRGDEKEIADYLRRTYGNSSSSEYDYLLSRRGG